MTTLKRSLSLPLITFYGLGTIIGAGIYVLVGKVAGEAGIYAPYAFLLAGVIALFSAFTYAELVSRFPRSAGEAVYIEEAWKKKWLAGLVGWLVVLNGVVSAATMARGFTGYFSIFVELPSWLVIIGFIIILGIIAIWGIKQSAALIVLITLLEIGGLLFIFYVVEASESLLNWSVLLTMPDTTAWLGIATGGFLAFYAFIGFEDMVNVAEEVQNPRRNVPIAIIIAIVLSTLLYVLIALVAVSAMPIDQLANSDAPLADLVVSQGYQPAYISLISLVAVINGVLVQIIMASRVMYGMGQQKMAPSILSQVSVRTQTPVIATFIVVGIVLTFALWLPLVTLAKTTSFIILTIFMIVNVALVFIKLKTPQVENTVRYPIWVPIIGALLCFLLLILQFI